MGKRETQKDTAPAKDQTQDNSCPCTSQQCPYDNKIAKSQEKICYNEQKNRRYAIIGIICSIILAISTIAIVVVTTIYTRYAGKQVESMNKTVEEMASQSEAMQDVVDANEEAVGLAERNINATQGQSRLDQRAWVGVIDMIPPSFKDGDIAVYIKEGEKNTGFGVNIGNSGKTPARKVKNKQKITTYPANAKFIPFYPPFNERERSVSVIQPGMKSILYFPSFDNPLTKEPINSLRDGENILYLYGEITYEDVFGKKHRTTFCSYLDKTLSRTFQCQTYNYAD
jgi:hypothetical protein